MRIDADTLQALHIFSTEHHPLIAKGPGKGKEGFSLFTLLDRTRSKIGRKCLKEWMLHPLLDPIAIQERQDGVELFLDPNCREIASSLMNHLQKVGAVDKILLRMQKCHSASMDFIVLAKTLSAAIAMFGILNGELRNIIAQELVEGGLDDNGNDNDNSGLTSMHQKKFAVLDRILNHCHISVLQDLHERLVSIVDQEATIETKDSVVIHYGFHEELDNAKEMFDNLDETLSTIGSEVLEKYPELSSLKVVFLPQVSSS
jgi:DNA mismatch repair ATPase MutS